MSVRSGVGVKTVVRVGVEIESWYGSDIIAMKIYPWEKWVPDSFAPPLELVGGLRENDCNKSPSSSSFGPGFFQRQDFSFLNVCQVKILNRGFIHKVGFISQTPGAYNSGLLW